MFVLLLCGCASSQEEETGTYVHISQEEAMEMMEKNDGHLILDVRRQDEYEEGHIPGAVCIPNEVIEEEAEELLKDKEQILLVYCRSGRRSKEAARKLAGMGYVNVHEFGGILDWKGEIVREERYLDGYELIIEINGVQKSARLFDNPSARDLADRLGNGEIEVSMSDYGGFEKVGELPFELARSDEPVTTVPGDVILYQGNKITIYYGENTWTFTRLGNIPGVTREEMMRFLGEGDVTVTFFLDEWEY